MRELKRCWINQPSPLQPLHKLNGRNVLYDEADKTIFFTEGPVHSLYLGDMPPVLSPGWRNQKIRKS